jgi:hypothetical protein
MRVSRVWVLVAIVLVIAATSGCSTVDSKRFGVHEAFPDFDEVSLGGAPDEAMKTASYEASAADVFRLIRQSATQANLKVEDVQQRNGSVFATRSTTLQMRLSGFEPMMTPTQFFYLINVKELGPGRSQVTIAAKVQQQCEMKRGFLRALEVVASVGFSEIFYTTSAGHCEDLNNPHWATDDRSAEPEMAQFLTRLYAELLQARLI